MEPTDRTATSSRRPYEPPQVVYEAQLEVRAGSPLGIPDPLDLTGEGQ
jgi:hypothetical protein